MRGNAGYVDDIEILRSCDSIVDKVTRVYSNWTITTLAGVSDAWQPLKNTIVDGVDSGVCGT